MKIKLLILIATILFIGSFVFAQIPGGFWVPNVDDRLEPIDSAWGIYSAQDIDFDGELLPDGLTCSDGQILKRTGADNWDCATDATGAGGSAIIFDIGDDGGNDSVDVTEIATTGDTNTIFTEPTADKILIAVGNNWPTADAATALVANGANCAAGEIALGVDASGAVESCYEPSEADITDLAHTATDITANIVDFNDILFSNSLAGNPALAVDECFLLSTTAGGGFICEGSTADTSEQLYLFPDVNGADTTNRIVVDATEVTDIEGNGLSIGAGVLNWSASGIAGHDTFTDFVANEHLDWTANVGTIDTGNYVENYNHTGDVTGDTGLTIGADKVLESMLKAVDAAADEECLTFEATTGDFEWQSCGAGSGDVTGVGDCADGACLDGSADGGSYVRIYDGDSHYLELNPGNITANRIISFRDAAGTVLLSGDTLTGDITATFDTDGGTATALANDTVAVAEFLASQDWGDMSTDASGNVTLDAGVVDSTAIAADTIAHADILDSDQADTKCIWFEDPVAADDFNSIWANKTANDFLLTELWAESDQTVTFMLQVDDGTPADIDTVDLAPAAGEAEDTALNGDTTVAAGEELDLDLVSVSGTPTWVSICFTGNWVD